MVPFTHRIALAAIIVPALATSLPASDVVPSAAAGVSATELPPKLIVLTDGTVVEGPFHVVQNGYERRTGAGRVLIAGPFIWFTAEDRNEAFLKLREETTFTTADNHHWMAEWCVRNGLVDEARVEVGRALHLDRNHAASLKLLKTIGPATSTEGAEPSRREPAVETDSDRETLGGLPPHAARTFVSRVQPILVNRCANGACHGSKTPTNGFSLRIARIGNHGYKSQTHDNLAAVLQQISFDDPTASPLVTEPQQPGHGGTRKPLFTGPAGTAQLQQIVDWIVLTSQTDAARRTTSPPAGTGDLKLTSGIAVDAGPKLLDAERRRDAETAMPIPTEVADPRAVSEPTDDEAAALLEEIIRNDRPDAFDPAAFNRQFAPGPDGAPSPPSQGPQP